MNSFEIIIVLFCCLCALSLIKDFKNERSHRNISVRKPEHVIRKFPIQIDHKLDKNISDVYEYWKTRGCESFAKCQEVVTVANNAILEKNNFGKEYAIDYIDWWTDCLIKENNGNESSNDLLMNIPFLLGILTNNDEGYNIVFSEEECKKYIDSLFKRNNEYKKSQ